jgi:AraC-like DNA-binding protein
MTSSKTLEIHSTMNFIFDSRPSDSPLVEAIWRTQSVGGGSFISTAASHWEMVVTKQKNKITLSIRGPETLASPAPIPEDAEFLGIIFKRGVFMPHFPKQDLVNEALHLSGTLRNSFQLQGSSWQFPDFENADTFVSRLQREGLLVQDRVVDDVLNGQNADLSLRSLQRRFLYVTGMTYKMIQQIDRARQALSLLQSGVPIPETAYQAGYFDQPHLTRSLKLFAGQTPAQIVKSSQSE